MNKKLIGLLIMAVLGVSACGAGAGGSAEKYALGTGGSDTTSSSSSSSSAGANNASSGSNPATTDAAQAATTNRYAVYGSLTPKPSGDSYFATAETGWEAKSLNEVQIDGRNILLLPEGKAVAANGIYESPTTGEAIYTGTSTAPYAQDTSKSWRKIAALKYAKYGEIHDEYEKHHIFAHGESTPKDKIPTTRAEVRYTGNALHTLDAKKAAEEGLRPTEASSEFLVNFGDRTLTGVIKPKPDGTQFAPISLKATLDQNDSSRFEGKDTAEVPSNMVNGLDGYHGASIKGGFYGPNAEEIAGAYYKVIGKSASTQGKEVINTTHGTFGASKQ